MESIADTIIINTNAIPTMTSAPAPTSKECSICMNDISLKNNHCTTPCGHTFCFGCITKSLQYANKCPYCRTVLVEEVNPINEEEDEEAYDDEEEDDDDEDDEESNYYDSDETDDEFIRPELNERKVYPIPLTDLCERMKSKGITYKSLLGMFINQSISIHHIYYSLTDDYIEDMNLVGEKEEGECPDDDYHDHIRSSTKQFYNITREIRRETKETHLMMEEDTRALPNVIVSLNH